MNRKAQARKANRPPAARRQVSDPSESPLDRLSFSLTGDEPASPNASSQPLTPRHPDSEVFATAPDEGEIPPTMQHMLWFSGLRGAVAFSCAHNFPNAHGHRTLFVATRAVGTPNLQDAGL